MIDKPMNPYAEDDFKNAVNKAMNNFSEDLKKMGEQIKADFPFMDEPHVAFEDFAYEYSGSMRLNYLNGLGAWQDVVSTLIAHGYRVSVHTEEATETERALDQVEKWVIIEFEEVE